MGFFSFLSRKSHDKGKSSNGIKSQNYSSTSSGALPVAAEHDDDAAPAPSVPRFREEFSERPSTAPNGHNAGSPWNSYNSRLKKGSSRGAPPVSLRMFKGGSLAQDARPSSRGTDKIASLFRPPTPTLAASHSRSNSLRSDNGRGFKDVLDAQSEIKPADFRTRVKAAGARDYGEDVAERNLGQNGFNLEAPQVQAFYAQSMANTPAFPRATKSEYPLVGQTERRVSTYSTRGRTQSLTSYTQFPQLSKLSAAQPSQVHPLVALDSTTSETTRDNKRRQSFNTFMPALHEGSERRQSVDRTARFYHSGKRRHSSVGPPTPSENLSRITCPDNVPSILQDEPLITEERPPVYPRDSFLLAKGKGADKPPSDPESDEANLSGDGRPRKERSFSLLPSSLPSARSLVASASTTGLPRKRHSLHTLHSSVASREDPATNSPSPPLPCTREQAPPSPARSSPTVSNQDSQDELRLKTPSIPDEDAAPSTPVTEKLIPSHCSLQHSTSHAEHSTSLHETHAPAKDTATSGKNRGSNPADTEAETKTKTRSVRALSASSATATVATVSDASSNPFHRPHSRQSRHTANTSVDLSPHSLKTTSRTSLHTPPLLIEATVPDLPADLNTTSTEPNYPAFTNFNLDDYLSSDDDSITCGSRRPRGEGEEELLFNDSGYGANGFQLPGLFDSLALTSPSRQTSQQTLQHHDSSASVTPPRSSHGHGRGHGRGGSASSRGMVYMGDSFGRAAGRRYIIDTGAHDYDEEYENGHEYEHDIAEKELEAFPDVMTYPVKEEEQHVDDDDDDADSLYGARRRPESCGAGIRSPPLLQPSRVINRLSAIIRAENAPLPNYSRPVTPKELVQHSFSQIPRPSSAHSRDSPRRYHHPRREATEKIEEKVEPTSGISITKSDSAKVLSTVSRTKMIPTAISATSRTPEITATANTTAANKQIQDETTETETDTHSTRTNTRTSNIPMPPKVTVTPTISTPTPPPLPEDNELVYKISDVSTAIKHRKEAKARARASGGIPGTGATSKLALKTSRSKRWSIATSIPSSVTGGVPAPCSGWYNNNSNNDEGVERVRRNASVSVSPSSCSGSTSTAASSSIPRAVPVPVPMRTTTTSGVNGHVANIGERVDTLAGNGNGHEKRAAKVDVREVGVGVGLGVSMNMNTRANVRKGRGPGHGVVRTQGGDRDMDGNEADVEYI